MPIMHRLACLRDDVIFFIFLYQRYKYRTDFTRVNEFGQCEEPTEEMLADKEETANDSTTLEKSETQGEIQEIGDDKYVNDSSPVAASSNSGSMRRRRGARDKK